MSIKAGLTTGLQRPLRTFSQRTTIQLLSRHSTQSHPPPSVDPNELAHFNALASSWWDPHGPSRLLHLMNPIRHAFLAQCLATSGHTRRPILVASSPPSPQEQRTQRGLHVLDVGCGGGIFAESAARLPHVASVTAIDPSPAVLRVAEAHRRRDPLLSSNKKLAYVQASINELDGLRAAPAGGYDVVTVFEVLEHVPRASEFLTSLLPYVRAGGWLVVSTIARTWTSWVVTKLVAEDVLGIVPRGTHDWRKYVNEKELREWFAKREGWESPKAMGVMYVPGLGWKEVPGGEDIGNYFFGIRRSPEIMKD